MAKKVLMADDDMHISHTYAEFLRRRAGAQVHRCHDGDSAIEAFNEHSFDLIILDIMMPHRERYDVTKTEAGLTTGVFVYMDIRGQNSDVQVIILTNVTDENILGQFPSDDSRLQICHKKDNPPSTLAERVTQILG